MATGERRPSPPRSSSARARAPQGKTPAGADFGPVTPLPRKAASVAQAPGALVVVFGGTFDPPHMAHLELAVRALRWAARELGPAVPMPQALLLVPAARSPFKAVAPVAGGSDRVAMLERAISDAGVGDIVGVWTDELDRAERLRGHGDASAEVPSYTIDTVLRLRTLLPQRARVRLLIGADQALVFHRWAEHLALEALAEPIVLLREPCAEVIAFESAMASTGHWSAQQVSAWLGRLAPVGVMDGASTTLRHRLERAWAEHEPLQGSHFPELSRGVLEHIRAHHLYSQWEG